MREFTALNLVPYLITAHYTEKYREIIESASKNTKYPIIALTDKQAILVNDDKYKIVGEGKQIVYNTIR